MKLSEPDQETPVVDNVLPLINVVFLLLIFFMLAGALQAIDLYDVEPPAATAEDREGRDPPLILIAADGRLAVGDRAVTAIDLQLSVLDLITADPSLLIEVKADRNTEARRVVEVMELLNSVGVERIILLAEGGS